LPTLLALKVAARSRSERLRQGGAPAQRLTNARSIT